VLVLSTPYRRVRGGNSKIEGIWKENILGICGGGIPARLPRDELPMIDHTAISALARCQSRRKSRSRGAGTVKHD
jgi:hypothetical protein